jgi:hypothetical protein
MAILTLALITAAIVAAYSSTSAEVVANNAMRAQDHAYQIAEAGLQQFLLRRGDTGFCSNCVANPAVADSEWTRVGFSGGYADVVAMRVRPRINADNAALFFIRATGVDTTVRMGGSGSTVFATRTVGHYASFGTATIKALGAWTSLNGISNNSGSSLLGIGMPPATGTDGCGATPAVAGIAVPRYGLTYNYRPNLATSTLGAHPIGSPPYDTTRVLDTGHHDHASRHGRMARIVRGHVVLAGHSSQGQPDITQRWPRHPDRRGTVLRCVWIGLGRNRPRRRRRHPGQYVGPGYDSRRDDLGPQPHPAGRGESCSR